MAAGLEVRNASDIIQITSDYKNMQFVGKGTVSVSNYLQSSLIGDTGEVIAFRVDDSTKWGITPPRIYTGMSNTLFGSKANDTASITYYRFKFTGISAGSFFEVYNSAGERCFSDAAKFMKVIGFVQGSDSGTAVTFSHGTGVTAAVIACKISSAYNPAASTPIQYLQLFNFASGLITAQDRAVQIPLNLPVNSYKAYSFLVLDVTGL